MALPEGVDRSEGVVDVEGRPPCQPFLRDLDALVDVEVRLEALEEQVAGLLREVCFLWNVLVVQVSCSSVAKLVGVVGVFGREGLAKV